MSIDTQTVGKVPQPYTYTKGVGFEVLEGPYLLAEGQAQTPTVGQTAYVPTLPTETAPARIASKPTPKIQRPESTVHCTNCNTAITLAPWMQPITFCPYCGHTDTFISDSEAHRERLAQRLSILVNQWSNGYIRSMPNPKWSDSEQRKAHRQGKTYLVPTHVDVLVPQTDMTKWTHTDTISLADYDILLESYRETTAWPTFSEYVVCMLTNKPPWSKGQREAAERREASKLN